MNGKQRESRSFETILHGAASPSRIKSQRRPPTLPSLLYNSRQSMFERFTERGRRCIYFARQSAAGYGSPTIETEHFILAILHEDPNLIGRFLPSKTTKEIRVEIEKRLVKTEASTSIDIPLCHSIASGFLPT